MSTPASKNNSKRKRTGSASPTSATTETTSSPTSGARYETAATPETARDVGPLNDQTGGNISLLSVEERNMSESEEETTADDQQPDEKTYSEFFHKNRFEALQSELSPSEPAQSQPEHTAIDNYDDTGDGNSNDSEDDIGDGNGNKEGDNSGGGSNSASNSGGNKCKGTRLQQGCGKLFHLSDHNNQSGYYKTLFCPPCSVLAFWEG